jgi:hypothetical protein
MSLGVPRVLLRKSRLAPFLSSFRAGCFRAQTPGFRSAPPWAEFLLRLRRVKIPLRYAHQDLQISQRRHTLNRCVRREQRFALMLHDGWSNPLHWETLASESGFFTTCLSLGERPVFDSGVGNQRAVLGDAGVLLVADGVLVERAGRQVDGPV